MHDGLSDTALVWKDRIQEWQASGKSLAQWSREHNFVYSQSIYWKMRFLGSQNKKHPSPKGFLELKDESRSDSGIIIETAVGRIHLSTNFDQSTLVRFMALLKGGLC
jgi:hypothetical protein